jgi:coenzyme F420 hydrogenase subunit beta
MTAHPQSPALSRVQRGDLCSGCGACAAIAGPKIAMKMVAPGFLRPEQTAPLDDGEERLVGSVCPGLTQTVDAAGRTDDALWGPYLSVEAGHATDPAVRHAGSSGGVLTAMLVHLLGKGIVDGVVQVRASASDPVGNDVTLSRSAAEVITAAGSRYAPSAPLAGLSELPGDGQRFAFVGKPCDAAALREWSRKDPSVAARFPVILSFFCAGVPSRRGAMNVLARMGADPETLTAFRYRGNGWPGRATATQADGSEVSMSYHDSWGGVLSRHVQHRCKICADGTGAAADLVCADAWECDADGYPLFEEREGTSLVMARTPLGRELLAAAKADGTLETAAFGIEGLAAIQPGQRERRRALAARLFALMLIGRPVPRYRGLSILAAARQNSAARLARNFAGTLRRGILRRPAG